MNSKLTLKFNKAIPEYMKKHGITQGVVCVTKDGEKLVHDGYGIDKNAVFRIGSISKAITNAAIKLLISEGKLSLDTKVFPLLDLQPLDGQETNPDLEKVTIDHLLWHKGGWDDSVTGDLLFRQDKLAIASGKSLSERNSSDFVRFMLSQPLQFEPGSKSVYSNFGYCVLGRVIEKVSGQDYQTFIKENILNPLEITSIKIGHTNKDAAEENEATYIGDREDPYGDFTLEMMDSYGGLIASSEDICKFMQAYTLRGDKRKIGENLRLVYFGNLSGIWSMALQKENGANVAILFNRRDLEDPNPHEGLENLVDPLVKDFV